MTRPHAPLARHGDTVRITVADYLHGSQPLTIRITAIGEGLDQIPGIEWIPIYAVDPTRPEADPQPLIVRADALRHPNPPTPTHTQPAPPLPTRQPTSDREFQTHHDRPHVATAGTTRPDPAVRHAELAGTLTAQSPATPQASAAE